MLDSRLRRHLSEPLDRLAGLLDVPLLSPDRLTGLGLVAGLASAVTAATELWWWSLGLWLLSRLVDGLDGPLARRRDGVGSRAGGFFDITADFVVYGATVVGVAIGATSGSVDPDWLPFLLVLLAYYVNGTAFLAFSSIAESSGHRIDDGRSFSFLGGLAEGTETIVVHSVWLIVPAYASGIAWVWAAVVAISAGQRIVAGYGTLRRPPV